MFAPDELHNLLSIIDKQFLLFVSATIGEEGLSEQDRNVLDEYGIDYKDLYNENKDVASLNFQLGALSNILSEQQLKKFTYQSLVKYIQSGNYIPLNNTEKAILQSIKMQSLSDIRSARGRIFNDVNNVVAKNFSTARSNQEEFLREKVKEGVAQRKSRKQIASDIARLTGDWTRDFRKSVAYISHTAFNEGRAAVIEKRYGGNDKAKVWFKVQPEACKACVKAYLTNGEGSEPILFTLQDLQANGNNIGRKQAEWLPSLSAMHPYCRCTVQEYIPGTVWIDGRFQFPKTETSQKKIERPKIRVFIDGREAWL
jgi:hypothetical protein